MKKTNFTEDDINLLIVSYLTNSIDKSNLARITRWINSSKDNRNYFNSYKDAWILSGARTNNSAIRTEQSWSKFRNKLTPAEDVKKSKNRKILFKYLSIAATWLAFFALGSVVTFLFTRKPSDLHPNPVSIMVPLGARSNITLPDGSNVWLNAGTTLSYNQDYGQKERRLHLTGEAYFDVSKDKAHPFIVQTLGITVHALGTKFNLKAYPDEKTISATLEEGKIDVVMLDKIGKSEKVSLSPKEKIVYFKEIRTSEKYTESIEDKANQKILPKENHSVRLKDASVLTNVQTELFTSWKDTRWIIEGEPLCTLAPKLERRYNLRFIFNNPELKNYKFSGAIENETVEQLLNAMRLTAPLDYTISKDTIKLTLNYNNKEKFGKIMTRINK